MADPTPTGPTDSVLQELVTQTLHRANATIAVVAVFTFIIGNWLLAHLATDWVMPGEVVSIGQQALQSVLSLWLFARAIKRYGKLALIALSGNGSNGGPPQVKAPPPASGIKTGPVVG